MNFSNAPTVYQLTGKFNNGNIGAGDVADVAVNGFVNDDGSIVGGGLMLGPGAGIGGSGTRTDTDLYGGFNIYDLAGINMPKKVCR